MARPRLTRALRSALRDAYGFAGSTRLRDLGGSSNLNLLTDGGVVVRVHAPAVAEGRLLAIQLARAHLARSGVPTPAPVAAANGAPFVRCGDVLAEAERFVAGSNMDAAGGTLLQGMRVLARVHDALPALDAGPSAADAPAPNHVAARDAATFAARAATAIRSWAEDDVHRRIADDVEALAGLLPSPSLPEQLVHGDFWDNNVLFDGSRCVAVLDLDMMGVRPRVDDLALALYYAQSTFGDADVSGERVAVLRAHAYAYDAALREPLSPDERAALPVALARAVLAMTRHLTARDDPRWQRRVAEAYSVDLPWSLAVARDVERWQDAFSR